MPFLLRHRWIIWFSPLLAFVNGYVLVTSAWTLWFTVPLAILSGVFLCCGVLVAAVILFEGVLGEIPQEGWI